VDEGVLRAALQEAHRLQIVEKAGFVTFCAEASPRVHEGRLLLAQICKLHEALDDGTRRGSLSELETILQEAAALHLCDTKTSHVSDALQVMKRSVVDLQQALMTGCANQWQYTPSSVHRNPEICLD
jgi:hypothetical protein